MLQYADVRDVGKAAKDFPELNFIIYHSGFRFTGGAQKTGWDQFEQTGRIDWVTDLADIPQKYGVKNAIFGGNSARLYGYTPQQRAALDGDPVALARAEYDWHGEGRTNLRYGYMQRA